MLRRTIITTSLALGLLMVAPTSEADASGWWKSRQQQRVKRIKTRVARYEASHSAPELDPNAAGSALVLLFGGVAYLASRRREDEDLA